MASVNCGSGRARDVHWRGPSNDGQISSLPPPSQVPPQQAFVCGAAPSTIGRNPEPRAPRLGAPQVLTVND